MEEDFKYKHIYDTYDKLCEVLSILLLVINAILIWTSLSSMPDVVPNHFDLQGKPNGFGGKNFIWGPFAISILLYVLLTLITRFPGLYKDRMTKIDKYMEYRLTVKMTVGFKVVLLAVFLLITFFMIQSAQLKMTEYLKFLIIAIVFMVFSYVMYWLHRFSKID